MQRFTSVGAIVYSACFLRERAELRGEIGFERVKSSLNVAKCLLWVFYKCGDNHGIRIRYSFGSF